MLNTKISTARILSPKNSLHQTAYI